MFRRRSTTGDRARRPGTLRAASLGPAQGVDAGSSFTFVESLEFWPELDDQGRSFATRGAYPGNEQGAVRGEWGEVLESAELLLRFQVDRQAQVASWASNVRFEGGEVHDLHWVGEGGTGRLTLAGGPLGIDRSPDGSSIAHLAWVEGHAILNLVAAGSGRCTQLLAFERDELPGSASVRWSPDSRLVLISRSPGRPSLLVDVATGRQAPLPWVGQASWWTGRSPSSLLLLETREEATWLSRVDLATASVEPIGAVHVPDDLPRHGGGVLLFDLEVTADGRSFVGQTVFGAASLLGAPVGGRTKWVQGTLPLTADDGPARVERWSALWCWQDTPSLELVQKDVRVTERRTADEVEVHPSILA